MHHQAQFNSNVKNKNTYKNLSCPNCKSQYIIKRGFRQTQNRGKIQRRATKQRKGVEIYYNFVTKHQTISCCPYELAVPELN